MTARIDWFTERRCRDTRPCCFRNAGNQICSILLHVYDKDGRCPFNKEANNEKERSARKS